MNKVITAFAHEFARKSKLYAGYRFKLKNGKRLYDSIGFSLNKFKHPEKRAVRLTYIVETNDPIYGKGWYPMHRYIDRNELIEAIPPQEVTKE